MCGFFEKAEARSDAEDGLIFRADRVQEAGDSREIAPALACCWRCGEDCAALAMVLQFMVLLTDNIKLTRERMCSLQEMNRSPKSVALKRTKKYCEMKNDLFLIKCC